MMVLEYILMRTGLRTLLLVCVISALLTPFAFAAPDQTLMQTFNTTTDKTITNETYYIQNTEYVDWGTWAIGLVLGIIFLVLSNVLPARRGAAVTGFTSSLLILWSAWGATHLDTVSGMGVTSQVVNISGQMKMETVSVVYHSIYHNDWLAIILGVLFIYSCVTNVFIVMDLKNVQPEQNVPIEGMDPDGEQKRSF